MKYETLQSVVVFDSEQEDSLAGDQFLARHQGVDFQKFGTQGLGRWRSAVIYLIFVEEVQKKKKVCLFRAQSWVFVRLEAEIRRDNRPDCGEVLVIGVV